MDTALIQEIMEHYRSRGAPQDQQMLIAMLRELQEEAGGALTDGLMEQVCGAYGVKPALLQALIRRVPGLRCANAPHRLEVCGTCRAGAALRAAIERTYGVKSGACCEAAGFSYHVTPCMKNCKNGPSVRWDGVLYSRADRELLLSLIGKK